MKRNFCTVLALLCIACSKNSNTDAVPEQVDPAIEVSDTLVTLPEKGGEATFTIVSEGEWSASVAGTDRWFSMKPTFGQAGTFEITVSCKANSTGAPRTGGIEFTSGTSAAGVSLLQNPDPDTGTLNGKKICVIGNSFVYYGSFVKHGGQRSADTGLLYSLCKEMGDEVTVYDCTYGGHHLYDFSSAGEKTTGKSDSRSAGQDLLEGVPLEDIDIVFFSESGSNNADFLTDSRAVMHRFKKEGVKFYYLCHSYTYSENHTHILNSLETLQQAGVTIVPWGHLVYDVWTGSAKVPGAKVAYSKTSFIVNKNDTYHPNPLSGYIAAIMAYSAASGQSAVGLPYSFVESSIKESGFSSFISSYYSLASNTNFPSVFVSDSDISGLQQLADEYLALGK